MIASACDALSECPFLHLFLSEAEALGNLERQVCFDRSPYTASTFSSVSSRRDCAEIARSVRGWAAPMMVRLFVGQRPGDAEPTDAVATEAMARSESAAPR